MDLHTAITLVTDDPRYERSLTNGAVISMRETWSLADAATFETDELRTAYAIVLGASEQEITEALNPKRRWAALSPEGTSREARLERHHVLSRAFEVSYGDREPVVVDDPRVAYVEDPRATEPDAAVVFARVGGEWHHRTGLGWCPCPHPGSTGRQWALTAAEHEGVLVEHLTEMTREGSRHLGIPWQTVLRMRWREAAAPATP
ncbi:hypothetical protein AB0A63_31250 [Lentzea sp. NPDC042327]|uniref:hypothetical protein n=1 Tax=Lentzea sp. NPDC042327 TaxID=3154801 RepID=UPI0033C8F1E9